MGNDGGGDFVKGGSCGREAWEREAERLARATGEGGVRSMRGSGLRRESPLRGRERCLPEAREREAERFALAGGVLCVPDARAECKGSRPCNGPCGAGATPRLLGRNLCLLSTYRPPGRGRRVLLGAAAPRSTPFQPPPTTPLGFPGGHCSHGSVGF